MINSTTYCPCGKKMPYLKCCGQFHESIQLVKTAEDLMRSRYTAFTKGMGDYLMISHHSTTRPNSEKDEIEKWAKSAEWDHLEIVSKFKGGPTDSIGVVEFKAFFHVTSFGSKKMDCIHEKSEFLKENGHWVYKRALNLD